MSEAKSAQQGAPKGTYDKGDRAAILSGRQGVGVRGEVFWVGENKYGPGMRYGLKGDDGTTYWVDETQLGSEKDAPPPPPKPKRGASKVLDKGARVEIIAGKGQGQSGEVFWVGDSKYGEGMRYGVRGADEETYWVDEREVKAIEAAPDQPAEGYAGGDELPPEAYEGDGELPPEAFEGGAGPGDGEPPPEAFEMGAELPPEAYEN